ncbi:MAG TPA: hypothetical protein VI756_00360 [Blastocatellia bacterium]
MKLDREIDQNVLWEYLLGEMDDSGQEQVELRYLEDREYLEALRLAEDDLIDAYAGGRLSPVSREHFETNFLNSPERIARVRFAETLRHAVLSRRGSPVSATGDDALPVNTSQALDNAPLPQNAVRGKTRPGSRSSGWRATQWAAALAAIVLLVLGVVLGIRVLRLSRELETVRGEQREARDTIKGLNRKIQEEEAQAQEPRTLPTPEVNQSGGTNKGPVGPQGSGRQYPKAAFSLVLSPDGLSRGGEEGEPRIQLGQQGQVVLMLLGVEEGYDTYRASITPDAGPESFLPGALKAHGTGINRAIAVVLDGGKLLSADYRLKVYGVSTDRQRQYLAAYYFKALRSP